MELERIPRIVQEIVPGKQITLAHVIANPDAILYQKLGLDPAVDYSKAAIGIVTMSPSETAIIAATSPSRLPASCSASLTGSAAPSSSPAGCRRWRRALGAIVSYCRDTLGFTVCELTHT